MLSMGFQDLGGHLKIKKAIAQIL